MVRVREATLRYCKECIDVDRGCKILFQMFSWQVSPHRAHPKIICHARRKPFLHYWWSKCICLNYKMYLSKLTNVFVLIAKCISPNCKTKIPSVLTPRPYVTQDGNLSQCTIFMNVFVQNAKLTCRSISQRNHKSETMKWVFLVNWLFSNIDLIFCIECAREHKRDIWWSITIWVITPRILCRPRIRNNIQNICGKWWGSSWKCNLWGNYETKVTT